MCNFIKSFLQSRRLKKKSKVYQKKVFLKKKQPVRSGFFFHKKKLGIKFFLISRFQKFLVSGVNMYSVLILRGLRSGALLATPKVLRKKEKSVEINSVFFLNKKIGTSGGSFIRVSNISIGGGYCLRSVYPSGVRFFLNFNLFKKCILGRSFLLANYSSKYSKFFFKKINSSVRGVAKNANEHYNGGKGRSGVLRGYPR